MAMKSTTAEALRTGKAPDDMPDDMDDAYIPIPDPLDPPNTQLREVWDVLREPAPCDQVVLIIEPRGAEYRVPRDHPIFYS